MRAASTDLMPDRQEAPGSAERPSRVATLVERVPPRVRRAGVQVLLVCVLAGTGTVAFGLGAYVTLRAAISVPEIEVPGIVDLDLPEAEERLARAGLRVEVAGRRHDDASPEGEVIEQRPAPGTSTKPGRPVRVVLSLGAESAVVPDLHESSQRRAQLALRAADLRVQATAAVNHPSVPIGRVVAQDPPPETEGFPGDGVSLLLSAGPEPKTYVMPALTGRRLGEARRALEEAGFRRVRVRVPEGLDERPELRVVDQRPQPGYRVSVEERILLEVGALRLEVLP